jgi:hypothetical protein
MKAEIFQKIDELTKGSASSEARIRIFEYIRDIPYYLVPQMEDPYEWAASIIETHKGSCSPKHYLMGIMFSRVGIKLKYATYSFHWGNQPINYPDELKKLTADCPVGYHIACKADINGRWVLVDATWDKGLLKAGFPVNMHWDGTSETKNAVNAFEEILHGTLQERLDFVREKKKMISEKQAATYAEFIRKFNVWLEGVRNG